MVEIDATRLAEFLVIVGIFSYLQSITGFALALGVLGAATELSVTPIATTAVVVSLLGLINALVGLYGKHQLIQWRLVGLMAIGMYPAIIVGVLLLQTLSTDSVILLKQLLGVFILTGGVVMLSQTATRPRPARRRTTTLIGLIGGIFGGLFSVVAPPLAHHLYREPISTEAIRATLYASIIVGVGMRMSVVMTTTEADMLALTLAAWSMPVVLVVSLLARYFRPSLSDRLQRRVALVMLTLLGAPLLLG